MDMVVELLRDQDKEMRSLGLEQIRSGLKSRAVTERLATLLPKLAPEAQAGLISALADRGDVAALPAMRALLDGRATEAVRVAAIAALGYLGDSSDAKRLIQMLGGAPDAEWKAAQASLVRLQDTGAVPAIIAELKRAAPPRRVALIEVVSRRRAFDALPELRAAATDDDASVRSAAMRTLGELAGPEQIAGMVQGVLRAAAGRERDAAEKAVMAVCARDADTGRAAQSLLAVYATLDERDQKTLLPTLGRVGGPDTLKIVERAIASDNAEWHGLGVRAVCNWPDASIAPRLIQLATTDEHATHRTAALRAMIRVAPLRDDRSDAQRLELLALAMSMATRDAERILVLDRARSVVALEALHFVAPYLDSPRYAQQACLSVVELAHHRELRAPNKKEFDQILDRVIAISKDPVVVDRAERYKKGQTWKRPAKPVPPPPTATSAAATDPKPAPRPNAMQTPRARKELARGKSQSPVIWLAGIAGAVCLLVVVFWQIRRRRRATPASFL